MSKFSFKELSALGSAIILAVLSWNYFPDAFLIAGGDGMRIFRPDGEYEAIARTTMLFWYGMAVVVVLVLFESIYHIALAIRFRDEANEPSDERDREVMSKARRNSYYVLDIGALILVGHLYFVETSGLMAAQLLLLLLVIAELVKYVSMIVHYRMSI